MLTTSQNLADFLPPIAPDANKYTRGSLLVLAGSARFPGAAVLAAKAAARTGAGYTTLAVPAGAVAAAQAHLLSIPVCNAADKDGSFAASALAPILKTVRRYDAIVLGCGLTVTPSTQAFVQSVLEQTAVPLLIDADALNILATYTPALEALKTRTAASHPVILTPHAGELERLFAATKTKDAQQLAATLGTAVVVAKGPTTIIAHGAPTAVSPKSPYFSAEGTPALAKAGTGDVLAGIIGSLLAQTFTQNTVNTLTPFEVAVLGVTIHSRAGRAAEQHLGTRSVMAEDLLAEIPSALH
jgi:NAD(P)H-hydrate epimerase